MKRTLSCLIGCLLGVSSSLFCQTSPGGVHGFDVWYSAQDQNSTIASYRTFDLKRFGERVDVSNHIGTSTLFFVLKPKSGQVSEELFLQLGDVQIYGDRIKYGRTTSPLEYDENTPCLVSLQTQSNTRYARRAVNEIRVGDSSLFDIAEVVVFPGSLDREEQRKVNTYLGLKYSVTITDNDVPKWRDYIRADNNTYWNIGVDRLYNERVIGLGRSDEQDFLQTQTITTTGDELFAYLDQASPIGEMPSVSLEDESYLILSESSHERSGDFTCEVATSHPLTKWKLLLQNWRSEAEYLVLRLNEIERTIQDEQVYLTDGKKRIAVPFYQGVGNDGEFRVPLDQLENNRHYFFTTAKQLECDELFADVQDGAVELNNPYDVAGWNFELQNLDHGYSLQKPFIPGVTAEHVEVGQYLVNVQDENGEVMYSTVLFVDDESTYPNARTSCLIRLFPDPVSVGTHATLSVENLPGEGTVQLTLSDMHGKVIQAEEMSPQSDFEWKLNPLSVPGTYTVTLYRSDAIYSVKLIVAQ